MFISLCAIGQVVDHILDQVLSTAESLDNGVWFQRDSFLDVIGSFANLWLPVIWDKVLNLLF